MKDEEEDVIDAGNSGDDAAAGGVGNGHDADAESPEQADGVGEGKPEEEEALRRKDCCKVDVEGDKKTGGVVGDGEAIEGSKTLVDGDN